MAALSSQVRARHHRIALRLIRPTEDPVLRSSNEKAARTNCARGKCRERKGLASFKLLLLAPVRLQPHAVDLFLVDRFREISNGLKQGRDAGSYTMAIKLDSGFEVLR